MAWPSNESRPRADRTAKFDAPVPPLKVPVVRSRVTSVVFSGSISSYRRPPLGPPPASSPNRIVPHGVRRAGSQLVVPVRMVATAPVARLMRTRPGWLVPPSLQVTSHSGCWLSGHRADMSRFAGAMPWVTTRASRLLASVASFRGSACASAALSELGDDCASGPVTPYRRPDWERSWSWTN